MQGIINYFPICDISGFPLEVDENWTLLGYYAASNGNSLTTFRDNLSAPFSRVFGIILLGFLTFECGTGTSVRNYHYFLRHGPEERSPLLRATPYFCEVRNVHYRSYRRTGLDLLCTDLNSAQQPLYRLPDGWISRITQ